MKNNWVRMERAFPMWINRITNGTVTILKARGNYIVYTDRDKKFAFTRNQAFRLARDYMKFYN